MKIIGAGFGRTGTTSATQALERLGAGPCMHMKKMFDRPDLAAAFVRHQEGGHVDWAQTLAEFGSTTDWPGCWIWQDLAEAFPDAPVLLTLRDPDDWYTSVMGSIHPATAPDREQRSPEQTRLMSHIWTDDFGSWEQAADRDHAVACFEAHTDEVRRLCPPERLVEWQVQDGWGPLCEALGVPVPDEPFPHLNDRADFREQSGLA